MNPPRDVSIDLIKTLAICDVLISHVAVPAFGTGDVGSHPWLTALFWACFSHASVSLFLMASGVLLLDPEKPLPLRKLYGKSVPRLLIALLFWAMCYKLFDLLLWAGIDRWTLEQAVKEVLLFKHEEHLYYLHIMLLVYAFLPLTRLLARHGDRRLLEYALGLWFLLGILYPTVRTFWPFTLLTGIPVQWRMNMTYASIGYTLLGWYLVKYHPQIRTGPSLLALLAGLCVTFGGTWARSAAAGKLETHFLEGMGVGVFLVALGSWGLGRRARPGPAAARAVTYISKASFCVFLTHIFFLKGLLQLGVSAQMGPAIITVPLLSALLLGCGCGVYALLSHIPGVRRWLV